MTDARSPIPFEADPGHLRADAPPLGRFALGMWRLADDPEAATPQAALRRIEAALDLDVVTFDHADIYGAGEAEEAFGRALALAPHLRERMRLVTKCGIVPADPARSDRRVKRYDTSKAHIVASVEKSLKALRTDRIELLLIHRPDPLMDAAETAEAFDLLRRDGKVLSFGVSNFLPHQVDLLQSRLPFPLAANQIEASVLKLDPFHDGTLGQCQRARMIPMAWSPLGGGHLLHGQNERERRVRDALARIGAELGGASVDQVALAWLLRHPARILPVLGTSRPERLRAAVAALDLRLDRQQWFDVLQASAGREVP